MNFPPPVPPRGLRAFLALAAFSVFACFPFDSSGGSKPLTYSSLSTHTWVLASFTRNGSVDSIPDSTLRVVFSDTGTVSMYGCNVTRGSYTLKQDTIRFGPMFRTAMACLSPVRRRGDDWSDSLLSGPLLAQWNGTGLILTQDSAVFRFHDSANIY